MQASFPTLPAGHPGLPACQDCFRVVKGKNPQSVCSMTQNDHQSAIRQNPAPSVSLVCFHLWLLTFPWLPFDSWQGRIINPLHPSCVGGVNESMARSTSRWESFFFSWEKAAFYWNCPVPALNSGLFPDAVGVRVGQCARFLTNSSLYDNWRLWVQKKAFALYSWGPEKTDVFQFLFLYKKTKTFRWISKDYSYICDHSCRFFSLSMSHSSLWYSSDEMHILKQQRQWENAVGDEKTHPLKMF